MRCFLIAALTAISIQSSVAQDRQTGVETTIQSQIDAFLKDDFVTAFTFASPNIKRLFGNAERFGEMVKNGFPMVWRPSEVQFLEQTEQGSSLLQKVLVKDASGTPYVLEYSMIQTDEGWQINGVQLLAAPPVGA